MPLRPLARSRFACLRVVSEVLPFFGAWQIHSSTSRFAQSDGDGLLGISCSMLAFPDMVHLFAYKLSGLR